MTAWFPSSTSALLQPATTTNHKEQPSAPWAGYQNEEELKKKILSLSEDKRNVLRAPPTGVNFDFEYCTVASPALLLLEDDPKLKQLRWTKG